MKILVVLPRFPYPLEKGDKLRAFNQIKELSKNNDIYLFCVSHIRVAPSDVEAVQPYCRDLRIVHSPRLVNYKNVLRNYVRTKSLQLGYWDSRRARKALKAFHREVQPDVIYSQMVRTMPLVSRLDTPKVMDFQDALSMNVERRMEHARGLWHYILHFEFKMLRSTEYNSFKIFDALTIISEPDSDAIPHRRNGDIHIIPNGVDFEYFNTNTFTHSNTHTFSLVFCGNMRYEPNIRAARYLAKDVMPLVWAEEPEARLLIAGAYPKHNVTELAEQPKVGDRKWSQRIVVSGSVPDIRESYVSGLMLAAPMQTGSGLQNKLLEAMAMGIPCVTTTIANDSLHATPGEEILIGDTPMEFAAHVVRLMRDTALRERLAAAGNRFVHEKYSWAAACAKLEAILEEVRTKK